MQGETESSRITRFEGVFSRPRLNPHPHEVRATRIPEGGWAERFKGRISEEAIRHRLARENRLREVMLPPLSHPDGLADRRFRVRCLDAAVRLCGLRKRATRNFETIRIRRKDWFIGGLERGFHGYRILHVSDFHLEFCPGILERLRRVLEGLEYDIVCLTARLITGPYANWFRCSTLRFAQFWGIMILWRSGRLLRKRERGF